MAEHHIYKEGETETEQISASASASGIPCKVWNVDRTLKKSVVASTLDELVTKGRRKLGIEDGICVRVSLEEDGTEVDDDEYLQCLAPNTTFILLTNEQTWRPIGTKLVTEDEPDCTSHVISDVVHADGQESTHRLEDIVQIINGNASKIITLSNKEMEVFASADQQRVANLMVISYREAGRMQLSCQRYLDDRTKALDAISLLNTYQQGSNKRQRLN